MKPDAIVHTAMTDDRVFEAIEDLIGFLEAGVNVTSSGPGAAAVAREDPAAGADGAHHQGRRAHRQRSLHVNGIDPGFANDVLPLSLTSLSQRIDEVRVMEICDYSTYYQPVVMNELFGFGKPDGPARLAVGSPGSWVWRGAAWSARSPPASGIVLDEPLTEEVDRRPAEVDTPSGLRRREGRHHGRGPLPGDRQGRRRAPRGPRPRHPHRARPGARVADPAARATAATASSSRGSRIMQVDFTHHGEHGDHNVSGMIVTAQRIVNAVPAVVAAPGGLVTALDLPLVTGRGLVAR